MTEAELQAWGVELGAQRRRGDVITLRGDLGSGKTTLARAICRGLGVTAGVSSPTYALVHEYESAQGVVFHVDLYRIDGQAALTNLGWDELLDGRGIVLIEWPERAGSALPDERLDVTLSHVAGDTSRRRVQVG